MKLFSVAFYANQINNNRMACVLNIWFTIVHRNGGKPKAKLAKQTREMNTGVLEKSEKSFGQRK